MTLAEMQDIAAALLASSDPDEIIKLGKALAQGVSDRLSEAQPCGWEAPMLLGESPTRIEIPQQWADSLAIPNDADAMARMLLAAADSARAEEAGE